MPDVGLPSPALRWQSSPDFKRTWDICTGLMKVTGEQALFHVYSPLILTTFAGQTMPHFIGKEPGTEGLGHVPSSCGQYMVELTSRRLL